MPNSRFLAIIKWNYFSTFTALFILFYTHPSHSQISTDGSLGPAAQTLQGPDYTIDQDLGARAGNNLFHSFKDFNINTSESATFSGDADIQRVISRVTGGNISNIDGLLKSEIPNADLFLVNPAGVMFGPNASININGSFAVSTSDYLKFGDNDQFFSQPLENEILSTEAPTAYGFLGAEIGSITFDQSKIALEDGKSLTVISEEIKAKGGEIKVNGGNVQLVSVGSEGEVQIDSTDFTSEVDIQSFSALGDISLIDGFTLDLMGEAGGGVRVRGKNLSMESAIVRSKTVGDVDGNGIDIALTDTLELLDGAQISTSTNRLGNGGHIFIAAENVIINGGNADRVTGIFTESIEKDLNVILNITHSLGNDLEVFLVSPSRTRVELFTDVGLDFSGQETILDDEAGSEIRFAFSRFTEKFRPMGKLSDFEGENLDGDWALEITDANENGNEGTLDNWTIELDETLFSSEDIPKAITDSSTNHSNLTIEGVGQTGGNSGDITIEANRIEISNAEIITSSDSNGDAGAITMNAKSDMVIQGRSLVNIFAKKAGSGDIRIHADQDLDLDSEFNRIITQVAKDGGNIEVSAGGELRRFSTEIKTDVGGSGGDILIDPLPSGSIVLDGSFGTGEVPFEDGVYHISENRGDPSGGNLFHSFREFTVQSGEMVTFTTMSDIDNILARVTGEHPSFIDGTIGVESPDVNLFFFNPNGVVFGSGARLDVTNAFNFHVSTADYIGFSDETEFHTDLSKAGQITSAMPSEFGFSSDSPAGLSVSASNLQVANDHTLSIVAGNLEIAGRGEPIDSNTPTLGAASGQINLISVSSVGEVAINSSESNFQLDTESFESLGDISLSDEASIDASDDGDHAVVIRAGNLIANNSTIASNTEGSSNEADFAIDIDVRENIELEEVVVSSRSISGGDSGTISIKAPGDVHISSGSNIVTFSDSESLENAGGLVMDVGNLVLSNSNIRLETFLGGNAGDVTIKASGDITLIETANIFSIATSGSGKTAAITLEAKTGAVRLNSSQIFNATSDSGDSGRVTITADELLLSNKSVIVTDVFSGPGSAGEIILNVKALSLRSSAIFSRSSAEGNGGTIILQGLDGVGFAAESVSLINGNISTQSSGTGMAGNIMIRSNAISLKEDSSLSSDASGEGDGGSVRIIATDFSSSEKSAVTTQATLANAGDIEIITANDIYLRSGSQINGAGGKDGGSITLNSGGIQSLESNSLISAVAGNNGGEITIANKALIMSDSRIKASAARGKGGNVRITTNEFFASENGRIARPESVIDVSSELVISKEFDLDLNSELILLPENFLDIELWSMVPCSIKYARGEIGSFNVVDREGVSLAPDDLLPSPIAIGFKQEKDLYK